MAGRPRKAEPQVALAAAMNAFWEKGFEATSMSDNHPEDMNDHNAGKQNKD